MADANKVELEIVTPKGRALKVMVDEVTAPSVEGEFGVMPGHVPLLAALRTGIVSYRDGSADPKRCAVGAGFAEAGANKLLILTDEYIERPQIDPVVVRKELAEVQAAIEKLVAKGDLKPAGADADATRVLIAKENWLATQLELYGDPPPATQRPFEEYGTVPPTGDAEPPAEPAN